MEERTKSSGNISKLTELVELLDKTFDLAKRGYTYLRDVKFYQEYPQGTKPEDLRLPAITYRIDEKNPTQEKRPRHREQLPNESMDDHTISISGQTYDCLVVFDVWGTGNREVDEIADQFEEFMTTFTGIFMEAGVGKITYRGLKTDDLVNWKDQVTHRIIRYSVTLESIYVTSQKNIEEIRIKVLDLSEEI